MSNNQSAYQLNDDEIKLSNKTISDAQVSLALNMQIKLASALKSNTPQNYNYSQDALTLLIDAAKKNKEADETIDLLANLRNAVVTQDIEAFYSSLMNDQVQNIPSALKLSLIEQIEKNTNFSVENVYQFSEAMSGPASTSKAFSADMIRRLIKAPETTFKLNYAHKFSGLNAVVKALEHDPNNKETTLFAPLAAWTHFDEYGGDLQALNKTNYSRSKTAQDILIKKKAIESQLDFYDKWNSRTFVFLDAAFNGILGGIDIATGFENNNDLRKAQGLIGCLSAVEMFTNRIAAQFTSATAKKVTRFAPVVGSFLSSAANFTSVAKHAEQVVLQSRSGNNSRAAGYAVMVALNSISGVLDIASGVCDLALPPPLNIVVGGILDVLSLAVGLSADLVGFFVDTFDSRGDQEILEERFSNYVNSEAFKAYLDTVATDLEAEGYDRFEFHFDAAGLGMSEGEAKNQMVKQDAIIKELRTTQRGAAESLWRIAILDYSTEDKDHHGRQANDLIRLLSKKGHPGLKKLYGFDGDDILEAGLGNTIMYGGKGNDVLILKGGEFISHAYGEEGNDVIAPYRRNNYGSVSMYGPYNGQIDGGEGNDDIVFSPLGNQSGGEGVDTLIVADSSNYKVGALLCQMYDTEIIENYNEEDFTIPGQIILQRGDLALAKLDKYYRDGFENLIINDNGDNRIIIVATSGTHAKSITVNWSENNLNQLPVLTGIYALGCDSIINLKNIPPFADIRIYGTGSARDKIHINYNNKILSQFSDIQVQNRIEQNIFSLFRNSTYKDNLDQKYSTTLNISRALKTGDVFIIDNETSSFFNSSSNLKYDRPRYIQCSGVRHYVISNDVVDQSIVKYDFRSKKEVLPHSTITIKDAFAQIYGVRGICCYQLKLTSLTNSDWSIVAAPEQYNNSLDLTATPGNFVIKYSDANSATVRPNSPDTLSNGNIMNIHCLRLNNSACTVNGSTSGLLIYSNGGKHSLQGGALSNQFMINGGECDIKGGMADDTYYISPLMSTATSNSQPSSSWAKIKATSEGNTLIIDNIQGLSDIKVTETSEGLTFSTTANGVFLTDLSWGSEKNGNAINLETRLDNLAKRFAAVLLPSCKPLKSYSGLTLAEYVKDRLSESSSVLDKIIALSWFTPLKLSGGSNTLVIDYIDPSWLTALPSSTVNNCFEIKSKFQDEPTSVNLVFSGFEQATYPEVTKYIRFGFNEKGLEAYCFKYNSNLVHYIDIQMRDNSFSDELTKIISIHDVSISDVTIVGSYTDGYQLSCNGKLFLIINYMPTVLHFGSDNRVIVGIDQVRNYLENKEYKFYDENSQLTFKEIQVGTRGIKPVDIEFPKTAMMNATFKLIPYSAGTTYTWYSSESWVQVDNEGNVKFVAEPTHNRLVTITAKSVDVTKPDITYQFRTHHWYSLATANGETVKELEARSEPFWVIDGPYQGLLNECTEHPGFLAEWKYLTPDIIVPDSNPLNLCLLDSDARTKQVITWSTNPDTDSTFTTQSIGTSFNWNSRTTAGERWLIGKNLDSYDYIYSFNADDNQSARTGELISEYTYQNNVHFLKAPLSGENYYWGVTDSMLDITAAGRIIFTRKNLTDKPTTIYARQRSTPVPPLTFSISANKQLGIGNIRIAAPQQAQEVLSLDPDLLGHEWHVKLIGSNDLLFIPLAVPASGIGKLSVATSKQFDTLMKETDESVRNSYQCTIPK